MKKYLWLSGLICPFHLAAQLRSRRRKALRERWRPRFALSSERPRIWIHTLSVGELQAAGVLLEGLASAFPQYQPVLTVATVSGLKRARELWGERFPVYPGPLHCPWVLERYLSALSPRIFLLVESDLWPHWLGMLRARGIPLIFVNAALSERSFRRLRRFRFLARWFYDPFSLILAASEEDRRRIAALASGPQVLYLGNLKYDFPPPERREIECLARRLGPFLSPPVLVCGSTHPGEEEILLRAFARLGRGTLILCPRRPERAREVLDQARAMGFSAALRSRPEAARVIVVDTLGELLALYGLADLAFVGGTLVPVGGHNLLEPAALKVPVTFGPEVESVASVARELRETGGGICVPPHPEEVASAWARVLSASERYGQAAFSVYERHRGAAKRYLSVLSHYL